MKRAPTFYGDALDLTLMVSRMKNNEFASAQKLDLMYALVKIFSVNMEDPWPGWTGFNTLKRQSNIPNVSKVGYLSIVNASPTEYSTLNEVKKSAIKIMDKLQLQQTVLVFDEAVYEKSSISDGRNRSFMIVWLSDLENSIPVCLFFLLYQNYFKMQD